MSNQCPTVTLKIPAIKKIAHDFKQQGIQVIGINANESEHYPEESFEKMQEYFKLWEIDFYYLHDDARSIARSFGAACTPDSFFLDGSLELIFRSRLDDDPLTQKTSKQEMYDAITEFLEKGKISLPEQPSMGSSIKWRFEDM
ncbi:MAG: redoxin domain-containing protein [Nanoarchaeota archaeon]|nr:redoxin domain-containing protein [Nanoarchaeota archaeon]